MNKLKAFAYRYVFSDKIPLNARVLNMICFFGFLAAIAAIAARRIEGVPFISIALLLIMMALIVLLLPIVNRFRLYVAGGRLALVVISDIIFPIIFIKTGGVNSGMTAYFALCIVLIFFLASGKARLILLFIHIAIMLTGYYVSTFFPSVIVPLTPFQQMVDHIQSTLIVGFFIGCVILFQNRIYLAEKEKADNAGLEIAKQDELLHVAHLVATMLLTAEKDQFDEMLQKSMELLARNTGVQRVYVWKNRMIHHSLHYFQEFEWLDPAIPHPATVRALDGFSYIESIPAWEEKFAGEQIINGPLSSLSAQERERLAPYGIASVLVVPVFLQSSFWGFVSFDDCGKERTFSEDEVKILCSGSLLMANAVSRNEMTNFLIKAREDALSSTQAKSDFLANMSHEIRTPINAVIGMTAIGKTSSDVERKDYAFLKIEEASAHLLGVINDILDMSKIEANKFELSSTEFSFEKMLRRVINVVNFRADEKRQKFTVHIDNAIPDALIGDDQRLAQVIANLLGNAVKFTPERGSANLSAYFVKEEQRLCTIQIEVSDTGIGISEAQQARLFHSFEQAESGTSRKFGGTGLGLAISRRIVEMMGGEIWVESELEKGATFVFTVQILRSGKRRASLLDPALKPENIRVLAADHDPDIRKYFEDLALRMGILCDTAADGAGALALMEGHGAYSICFADWKMPGMDGVALTRRIKRLDPKLPVVLMLSAAEWGSIESEAKSAGVDRFLLRPLFPSAIADLINECVGAGKLAPMEDPAQKTDCFQSYRLLLVDDMATNREIVTVLLKPTLLKIDCAENGAVAVQMFRDAPDRYDMVFMDVQMPEMDGYEATRQIRAVDVPAAKQIPIIAMTANVFREDVERCLAAGMDDHMGKPLDFDDVLAKLRTYLPHKEKAAAV
ncbi:MAG: response regulator [Clostridiales Family XIII bacterium]|nr:response regulator [Clostridiales Family XIII bacterium]